MTPHGNEPAGGEATVKELYELAARTDCDNAERLKNLDLFLVPARTPDDRDANVRTTAFAFDPNRDLGVYAMPESRALVIGDHAVPGPLLHRRPPADVGLLLPARPGRRAGGDLAQRAGRDPGHDRAGDPAGVQRPDRPVPQLQRVRPLRARVRRHRPLAADGRRRHDVREGQRRELRQAGLRPLPGDGHDGERRRRAEEHAEQKWIAQWPEAVQQGQKCQLQDNTQVSPPAVDNYEIGQPNIDQNPNVNVCGYYYLPDAHSGDVA